MGRAWPFSALSEGKPLTSWLLLAVETFTSTNPKCLAGLVFMADAHFSSEHHAAQSQLGLWKEDALCCTELSGTKSGGVWHLSRVAGLHGAEPVGSSYLQCKTVT